jgi:hypothetical protein
MIIAKFEIFCIFFIHILFTKTGYVVCGRSGERGRGYAAKVPGLINGCKFIIVYGRL